MGAPYYPTGPFIGRSKQSSPFEAMREDFLLEYSERTARAYRADLEDFAEWCVDQDVEALGPSPDDVTNYLESVTQRGYAPSTRARRASTLRRFMDHVKQRP